MCGDRRAVIDSSLSPFIAQSSQVVSLSEERLSSDMLPLNFRRFLQTGAEYEPPA